MNIFGQMFRGTNGNIDLSRIVGLKASLVYPAPFIWAAFKHGTIPDPASFGTGYLAVLGGIAALIGGKEIAVAKATATHAATTSDVKLP